VDLVLKLLLWPSIQIVYKNGFQDYSWNTGDFSLTSTTYVHSGTYSVSFNPNNFNAIYFECNNCIDLTIYNTLQFWVNGGTVNSQILRVQFRSNTNPIGNFLPLTNFGTIEENSWQLFSVPFSAFGFTASDGPFDGFTVQSNTGTTQTTIYFDDFSLLCIVAPTTGSAASTSGGGVPVSSSSTSGGGAPVSSTSTSTSTSKGSTTSNEETTSKTVSSATTTQSWVFFTTLLTSL